MNTLKLFLDLTGKQLRTGPFSAQVFQLPQLYQNDVVPVELYLIEATPEAGLSSPYRYVSDTALSVKIGVVTPHPSASTIHASADLTPLAGGAPPRWLGTLSVGTLSSLLTGSLTSATASFEVQLYDAATGDTSTVLQIPVSVRADGLKPGTPPPATPPDSYLTALQAGATYARKIGASGESFTLVSPDGSKRLVLYITDDGEFRQDVEEV